MNIVEQFSLTNIISLFDLKYQVNVKFEDMINYFVFN